MCDDVIKKYVIFYFFVFSKEIQYTHTTHDRRRDDGVRCVIGDWSGA